MGWSETCLHEHQGSTFLKRICTSLFLFWYLKLHRADPIENFSHVFTDLRPGDLVVALCCGLNSVPRQVIKSYHVGQDPHCLIEGTEPEGKKVLEI